MVMVVVMMVMMIVPSISVSRRYNDAGTVSPVVAVMVMMMVVMMLYKELSCLHPWDALCFIDSL